jgi:hypothetical protein
MTDKTQDQSAETPARGNAKSDEWKMPEPKFQQTSGYLPGEFLQQMREKLGNAKNEEIQEGASRQQIPLSESTFPANTQTKLSEQEPSSPEEIDGPAEGFNRTFDQKADVSEALKTEDPVNEAQEAEIFNSVAPQPEVIEISEERPPASPLPSANSEPRRSVAKILLAVLGIFLMVLAAVAFLIVIYYLFIAGSNEVGPF